MDGAPHSTNEKLKTQNEGLSRLIEREVVGAIHFPHAAAFEQGDEAVTAGVRVTPGAIVASSSAKRVATAEFYWRRET